jgi:plastocyanin
MVPPTQTPSPTPPPTETDTPSAQPLLKVQDQQTNGQTVAIQEVQIDKDGWLVIHPEKEGGGPKGSVTVATKQISGGMHLQNTALQLSEQLSESQTVYAMLHYEDPKDGEFTFPENGDPPVKKDGKPLVKPISLTVSGGTTTVTAEGSTFNPVRVEIDPGMSVKWTNDDAYGHDVTAEQFHNKAKDWTFQNNLPSAGSVSRTFDSEGVYEYYCTIHGRSQMCGAVLVGDVSLGKDLPCEGGDGGGGGYGY